MPTQPESNKSLREMLSYLGEQINDTQDVLTALREQLQPLLTPVPQEVSADSQKADVGYDIGNTISMYTNQVKSLSDQLRILRSELSI